MKNIKKILAVIIIVVVFSTINSSPLLALKQAPFPSSQSVQPIPKDAYPNISGNANSTVGTMPNIQKNEDTETVPPSQTSETTPQKEIESRVSAWWFVIPIIAIIFIFIYIKLKKK